MASPGNRHCASCIGTVSPAMCALQDVDVVELARLTDGFCGADIADVCRRAIKLAISEAVDFLVEYFHFRSFVQSRISHSRNQHGHCTRRDSEDNTVEENSSVDSP